MPHDDPLGELGRSRSDEPGRERPARRRHRLTDDETVRLIDAAMAVLGATGGLVRVGEDILRERRAAIAGESTRPSDDGEGDDAGNGTGGRIDLTY